MSARDELALTVRQNFSGWMGPAVSYDVADAILAKYVVIPKELQDDVNRMIEKAHE